MIAQLLSVALGSFVGAVIGTVIGTLIGWGLDRLWSRK